MNTTEIVDRIFVYWAARNGSSWRSYVLLLMFLFSPLCWCIASPSCLSWLPWNFDTWLKMCAL